MHTVEPSSREPLLDRPRAETQIQQLTARHDSVLPSREHGDIPVGSSSRAFSPVCGVNVRLGGHGGQDGSPDRAGGARNVAGVRRYAYAAFRRTGRVVIWLTKGFWAYCGVPASSIAG